MIKSHPDSRIEIWSANYINNDDDYQRIARDALDKVDIVQIEPGTEGNYIVEVVDKNFLANLKNEIATDVSQLAKKVVDGIEWDK